ncbi:LysR family transcriptional regulator, partial [Polymorphobacter sp.]|uniref:LysR family transcriptional regulator n=1 Tax=Polymorphobacter sp. TaxID=1909290 RepID=UPI003F6E7F95
MDLINVSRFLAVIEEKSFARAAKKMQITPQAIAFSITKLETELDAKLFDREPGGVTSPTEYAMILEEYARTLMINERRAVMAVRLAKRAETGWLRIGIGETMADEMLAPTLMELLAERPDVRIAVVENYTDQLIERMQRGELDLVAGSPVTAIDRMQNLAQHVLFKATDFVVARADHPLAGKAGVTLEDMQDQSWLVPYARRDTHDAVIAAYLEAGRKPPSSFLFSDAPMLGQVLIKRHDFLLLSPPEMAQLGEKSAMVRIDAAKPTIERTACLIYPSDRPLSELAKIARDKILVRYTR